MGIAWASAALAVVLFALPLAVALHQLFLTAEMGQLERSALRTAITVGPDFAVSDPAELPAEEPPEQLGLYDSSGRRLSGTGPAAADSATRRAGRAAGPAGGVRPDRPRHTRVLSRAGDRRGARGYAERGGLAAHRAGLGGAGGDRCHRRDARGDRRPSPGTADQCAAGAARRGIPGAGGRGFHGAHDIERHAGDRSGRRRAQRHSGAAERPRRPRAPDHQQRVAPAPDPTDGAAGVPRGSTADPGADLRGAARAAIESVDRVEVRIDELVELTRGTPVATTGVALQPVLQAAGPMAPAPSPRVGRRLRLHVEADLPLVSVSGPGIEQILEILLENAMRHGTGTVTVTGRTVDVAVAVDVGDEGAASSPTWTCSAAATRATGAPASGSHWRGRSPRTPTAHCGVAATPSTTLTLLMPPCPRRPPVSTAPT